MPGKQAKILSDHQVRAALGYIDSLRYPEKYRAMFLLSCKAGLRAAEIAQLTWSMVTGPEGGLADVVEIRDDIAKNRSGRLIPMHRDLRAALAALKESRRHIAPDDYLIPSERGASMSAQTVTNWFFRLYRNLGFAGCSSHSGRRTFVTKAAKAVSKAGGSLRDVQQLAGHKHLQTTQRYIEGSTDAKRQIIDLI